MSRRLFDSHLSLNPERDKKEFENIFIDPHKVLRSPETILQVEFEYTQLYRNCWNWDTKKRYDAVQVRSSFLKFLSLLDDFL